MMPSGGDAGLRRTAPSVMFERPHHLGLAWATRWFGPTSYPYVVTASALLFWTLVAIIPVYNKQVFRKDMYPYPVATAAIQLSVVAALLILYSAVDHVLCRRGGEGIGSATKSWIFGPHFLWKLRWTLPIGVLFGLKYGLTNMGLALLPAPTHLLLQSTDIVWTLLGAWWINGERVTTLGMVSIAGCTVGSTLLAYQAVESSNLRAPVYAIAVNLTSPVLLGLCLTYLRVACTHLMNPNNRVGGSVDSFELTALKLAQSAVVAGVFATYLEAPDPATNDPGCWAALGRAPLAVQTGVTLGALPILAYQVNCTFFAFLTSAVGIGLLGQVKIVPQWLLATLFGGGGGGHAFSGPSLLAAGLTFASVGLYAYGHWREYRFAARAYTKRSSATGFRGKDGEAEGLAHHGAAGRTPYGTV